MEIICYPGTQLELSEPHIAASFRSHSWKETLGEVLEKWTSTDLNAMSIDEDPISPQSVGILLRGKKDILNRPVDFGESQS